MAARITGINRDIRKSHPFQYFKDFPIEPTTLTSGDVLARGMLRNLEARQSFGFIKQWAELLTAKKGNITKPDYNYKLQPDSFAISLTEGWRGEICHTAVTDHEWKNCSL